MTQKIKPIILTIAYRKRGILMNDSDKKNKENKEKFNKHNIFMSICTLLVFAFLGMIFTFQAKSIQQRNEDVDSTNKIRIEEYEKEIEILEKEIAQNEEKNDILINKYNSQMEYLFNNEKQFYDLIMKYESDIELFELYAGLTKVTGSGIDIGIDDAHTFYESTPGFLVHDIYLNEIVNTLRAAGAEAIAINGERIVSMSETLCIGPSIRVNGKKLFAPYHIEAIGNPQALLNSFKNSSIYETMIKDNLIVDPVTKDNIIINKYTKSYNNSIDLLAIINEEMLK